MKPISILLYKSIALVVICSFFFSVNYANAQWQQTSGPIGVYVNCLIQHDTVAVCGTMQGLYFSSDSGSTWQNYPKFQNKNIQSIFATGDTLILIYSSGFTEEYYYDSSFSVTSFDNGVSWSNPLLISIFGEIPIALKEVQGKIIALDLFVGPYISDDYGLSWTPIPLPAGYFVDLKFTGKNHMFLVMNDVNFNNFFFLSRLDSISFIPVDPLGLVRNKCAVDSVIFGADSITPGYIDIVKSVDYGQTWTTIATTSTFQNFGTYAIDSVFGYRTSYYYSKYTSDFGVSWDSVAYNVTPYFQQYRCPVDLGNNNLLVTTGNGFSVYNTVNDSGIPLLNKIKGSLIGSISSDDSVVYCTGYSFYGSYNDGNTWDTLSQPFLFNDAPQIIIGDTLFTTNFDVYRSYDGGRTWTTLTMPTMVFYMAKKGNRIYASSGWETYYSDDYGDNWILVNSPPQQTACGYSSNGGSLCTYANHLFFADNNYGGVFRLDQNDQTWTYLYCLGFDPFSSYDDPILFTLNNSVVISSDIGIFYSNDTGATWTASACNGLPRSVFGGKIYPTSIVAQGTDWIAACGKAGVLYSYDYGNHWYPLGGPSPFIATGVTISHDQLFVSTQGRGVWTTTIPLGINRPIEKNNFVEVYPNPATESISLKNLVDTDYPNLLYVYNSQGQLVMYSSVKRDEKINISSLTPGIYYCKVLNKDNYVKVCRFVVK